MSLERKSFLLVISACLLWGLDLVLRYPVTLKVSYVAIVFLESLIGLIFMAPVLFKKRNLLKKIKFSEWGMAVFVGGVGMSIAGYLETFCIQKATPGLFSFFQIFQPLFVLYLARVFLKEKIDNMYIYWGVWIVLSAILMFSVDLELMMNSDIVLVDILIALSCMLIWGSCTIFSKKFLENNGADMLVGLRCFFAFLFSGIILVMKQERLPVDMIFEADMLARFVFMGVVAGVFGMYMYYRGLRNLEVSKISFIEVSYPAFGMIFSAIYTFEGLTFFQLLGAGSFFAFMVLFFSKETESGTPAVRAR